MVQGGFTDVYSLAATYYYALSGTNLPTAPDRLLGTNYVPLKQLNLGVPDSVSDAVDHALVLNVDQRTQTMQEFIQGIAPAAPADRRPRSSYESGQLARQREEFLRQEAARRQAEQNRRQQEAARLQEAQRRQQEARQMAERNRKQQEEARLREAQLRQQEAVRLREAQLRQQKAQLKQQELVRQAARRQAVKPAGPGQGAQKPYVAVIGGPAAGKSWMIPPNQMMKLGRSATEVNLRIEKPEDLSRIHCILTYEADKGVFRIRDVSSFGVYYNGKRLEKGKDYEFRPPARFALASTACLIEVGVRG